MGDEEKFWSKVSYVEMSKNRKKVLNLLSKSDKPLTPSEMAEEMDVVVKSASRAVRQLAEKKLVTCINPEAPRYRRYNLTEEGSKVIEELEK